MKTQILFPTFFIVAIFTSVSWSYGQDSNILTGAPASTPAIALVCSGNDDALHPLPGETYAYTIATTPEAIGTVHWFVTDANAVLTDIGTLTTNRDLVNGTYVLDATPGVYDVPGNTAKTINVSWKSFNGNVNEVLLVAYVTGALNCADNIDVFRIIPSFGFTLDIAGLLNGGGLGNEECISPVVSATYNGGTNLTMDYGDNYVFFSVNAANFVNSWMPTFTSAVTGGSVAGAVEWAYPADAIANDDWNPATEAVVAQDASGVVGPLGECIVLRVQIVHNAIENNAIAGAPVVTVGVNGVMYDPVSTGYGVATNADLDEPLAAGPCVNNITDEATYTLTPRPALVDATVPVSAIDPGFEPKN